MRSGQAVLWADLVWGIRRFGLENELRAASRGRALVLPTNAVMGQRFAAQGLYRLPLEVPARARQEFRRMVVTQLPVRRSSIPFRLGCGLLYVSHQLGNWQRTRLAFGGAPPRGSGVVTAAANPPPGLGPFGTNKYSALGQGYNVITGLPLSIGMSSLDPGFTLQPVFDLSPTDVSTLPTTGGSCESQFSTSVYNSMSDFKESLLLGLRVDVNFALVSLTANGQYNTLSKTSSSAQVITTNSGAKVYIGGYGLAKSFAGLRLHQAFLDNVRPLYDKAAKNEIDQYALQSLLDNYGTHVVSTVYWGGLASVTTQVTASAYSSLTQTGVSFSASAQVAVLSVSVGVNYESVETSTVRENSQTFGQVLIPSWVNLTFFNPTKSQPDSDNASYIDCVAWTNDIRRAVDEYGWRPPVQYTVTPLHYVFNYPKLFPTDMRNATTLARLQSTYQRYIQTCGYKLQFNDWQTNITSNASFTACPPTDNSCVKGTYRVKGAGCRSCFGDGTKLGPNCNTTSTISCTANYCYCIPDYAPAARIYGCVPLQGDPWVDVAEGEVGVAQCPKGLVITKLANISYGTTDGRVSADSEIEVYRHCWGHVSCSVPATNEVFGDPAPGTAKRLRFTWECDYPRLVDVAENFYGQLACPQTPVTPAFNPQGCPLLIGSDIRPFFGNWALPKVCNSSGLYNKFSFVVGQPTTSVLPTRDFVGSDNLPPEVGPCDEAGVGSYRFRMQYSCTYDVSGSQPKRAEADDGQVAQVSCPCQKVAEIFVATWTTGNTDCAQNYIRTDEVKRFCNVGLGNSSLPRGSTYSLCPVPVDPSVLGPNPCPDADGTKKLRIDYTCA